MKSGKFVWGMLLGLIVGIGATTLSQQLRVSSPLRSAPTVQPRTYVIRSTAPSLPPGWRQHEFNGHPYYLVPLGVARR